MHITTRLFNSVLKRSALGLLVALSSSIALPQTYYYIDHISVAPASPTTADAITITVEGSLSNTASYIELSAFQVSGTTVYLTVNAANQGIGLDVLVPHAIQFPIGNLAAGSYTIIVMGNANLDSAPSPEHQFVVSGGTPTDCDSLEIIGAGWGVFSSDQIVLTVANHSSDLFDYPGFVLLDAEGDTIAKETVNYFGIGQGPQDHTLDLMPGVIIDGNTVSGQLYLWSGFYTEQECDWPVTLDLCPTEACTTMMPYLWNLGDALVIAAVPYAIENEDGLEVASGTFYLTIDNQSAYGQEICLPAGHYTLQLDQVGVVGGQLYYGMTTSTVIPEQTQASYTQGTAVNESPFSVFADCIDGSNVIPMRGANNMIVAVDGDRLLVSASDNSRIGIFELLDIDGRILSTGLFNTDRGELPLAGLAQGAYVFRSERLGPVRFIH